MLAILGRGIQRVSPTGPWGVTDALEVCDEKGAHLPFRVPDDDENPNCRIGGGNLNVLAGSELCVEYAGSLKLVVCAYGGRSPYLTSIDAPSESEVMSEMLILPAEKPEIAIWPREKVVPGPTNTNREIQNVFELALERGFTKIGFVTVQVHLPRTVLMAALHRAKPEFRDLVPQFFASELVLENAKFVLAGLQDPEGYRASLRSLLGSKAFARTLFFEQRGMNALLAGNY